MGPRVFKKPSSLELETREEQAPSAKALMYLGLNLLWSQAPTVPAAAPKANRETRGCLAPHVHPPVYQFILVRLILKWDNLIPVTPATETATREKGWNSKDECVEPLFKVLNSATH